MLYFIFDGYVCISTPDVGPRGMQQRSGQDHFKDPDLASSVSRPSAGVEGDGSIS
jgi:hypothetical protein